MQSFFMASRRVPPPAVPAPHRAGSLRLTEEDEEGGNEIERRFHAGLVRNEERNVAEGDVAVAICDGHE
jgi:hypothetical protein